MVQRMGWVSKSKTWTTMGAMMPMVPQEVPVAKPIAAPMMKITAGRNLASSPAPDMALMTKSAEYMP